MVEDYENVGILKNYVQWVFEVQKKCVNEIFKEKQVCIVWEWEV